MQKLFLGATAYVVLTFGLAFVWNMILFREAYVAMGSQALRANPIMPLGLAAILIEAAVLSWLFSQHFDGSTSQGLLLALAVGAFSITYGALVTPAKFVIDPIGKYVLLEVVFGLLHYGAAGLALSYVFRKS